MKIITVSYQKTYTIGPYLTDKIGMEASKEDGDTVADMLDNMRAIADEWHKAEHPHLYQEEQKYPQPYPDPNRHARMDDSTSKPMEVIHVNGHKEEESTEGMIKNAKTLEELTPFKLLAGQYPDLYKVYCQRLKELTQ